METEIGGRARDFPVTRWTLIRSSRDNPERQRAALQELLTVYWKPLYFYVRRKGLNIEAAKDAVQDFAAQLLERGFLERLDPSRGRFRSFLRAAFDHFLINGHAARIALKRGGGRRQVALDFDVAERQVAASGEPAETAFDREWATGVMERALQRLRAEFESGARKGSFDAVLRFFKSETPPSYAEVAKDCGMTGVQFKAFLHRARGRFRDLLKDEIAQTVNDDGELDAEMADLLRLIR